MIMGHFFANPKSAPTIWWRTLLVLPAIGVTVAAIDLLGHVHPVPIYPFVYGVLCGRACWPQAYSTSEGG
jgi:hypothetical protein